MRPDRDDQTHSADQVTPAERERRRRARRKAGRRVYTAELDEVATEALIESFHLASLEELLEIVLAIAESVERHDMSFPNVLLSLAATRAQTIWSMPIAPLLECAPRCLRSIQPSLKSSSICMRGVGFFIPWARNLFGRPDCSGLAISIRAAF